MKSTNHRFSRVIKQQTIVFFKAVQHNELVEVKRILDEIKKEDHALPEEIKVINLLTLEKSGDSALHICARNGYIDMIKYFIEEEEANLELINFDGKTALHDAAQFCQPEIAEYLLSKGANVNVVKKADWTPLMLACTKPENLSVVKILLNAGAKLNFINKDGWTCIHLAAREGNVEILKALLNSCDEIERRKLIEAKSRNGRKAIHTAVMHGHLESVKLLTLNQSDEEVNCEDNCGTTPLMDACRCGFESITRYFIEVNEVDPSKTNRNGVGLLHVAAEADQPNIIEFLVRNYGLDVNKPSNLLGFTPLHWASREVNCAAVKALLKLEANPYIKDDKGRTAKDLAEEFQMKCIGDIFEEYEQNNANKVCKNN